MRTKIDEGFVLNKISSLLSQLAQMHGPLRPPIDPAVMADLCRVLSVEHRHMVPEGVLSPVPGGFRIYLQSNFMRQGGANVRNRFTLAHELAHTLFFNLGGDVPRPIKGSPKGQKLERLCNFGAGQILVPSPILRKELEAKGSVASAESIFGLARAFEVSAEVLIRRLQELGHAADGGYAAVLVGPARSGKRVIRAACYDTRLLCNASRPAPGKDFDSWVLSLLPPSGSPEDAEWVCTTQTATITARKVPQSNRSFILDLRFERPPHKAPRPDPSTNST